MIWLLATGLFDEDGFWVDEDVWIDEPPPVFGTDPWLLEWGVFDEEGFWVDDDVWRDGPSLSQRGVVFLMITPSFDRISNLATWEERVRITDVETGDPLDLSQDIDDIVATVRDPWTGATVLTEDLESGGVYLLPGEDGTFGWKFTNEQMAGLDPKTYEIGVLFEYEEEVAQVILGRVSVIRGL